MTNTKTFTFKGARQIPIIGVLVGEVIYNLRAALDYLIYELAQLDSQQIVEGTQFPIEDSGKVFVEHRIGSVCDKRRGVYLRGINDIHVALISRYQPCYGCYWTKVLRNISDHDKHRRLTVTYTPVKLRYGRYAEAIALEMPVNMNFDVSIDVVFTDGMPVIETLEQLHSQISDTIGIFYHEFK